MSQLWWASLSPKKSPWQWGHPVEVKSSGEMGWRVWKVTKKAEAVSGQLFPPAHGESKGWKWSTWWSCWAWGATFSTASTDFRDFGRRHEAVGTHAKLRPAAAWGLFFWNLPIPCSILIDGLKTQGIAPPVQKNNLIKPLVADTLQTFSS